MDHSDLRTTTDTPPQPAETDTIVEVENATVTFEMDRGQSTVLNDVSISLQREEVLGVVGESGSGKSMFASSLLNAVVDPGHLTGSIRYYPTDGEPIELLDLPPDELKRVRWEEISMVFQGAMSSFNPTMTIREHFTETLSTHDADMDAGMDRTHELLRDLHLEPERVLDAHPHELSGGMKQRALIGLSLVLEPEVLVMDEPTAALDLLMQRSILNLLYSLKQKYDLTLVFITHDLPLVAELADRLAVMYAFEFVEVGPTADLISDAAHPYTRALLKSTPNLRTPLDEMEIIGGSSPDPVDPPPGCPYHPRCPLATEVCEEDHPGYYEISAEHGSKCHHWDQTDEIPLEWGDSR